MKPSQIVVILLALSAGGLAAFLATRGDAPAPVEQAMAPQPKADGNVLVARADIGVGERLTASDLEWRPWPQDALNAQYITKASMPDAVTQLEGSVARFEIFSGDPIRDDKLVKTDQGYLSAVLEKGMRGVSVSVSADSGSGGFIVPNDHVDVISTHSSANGQVSETVLENVKVLAIGKRLGEKGSTGAPPDGSADPSAQVFDNTAIATLELDPSQAQVLVNAGQSGKLSLVLRSIADFADNDTGSPVGTQAVKVIRFGRETSVQAGAVAQNDISVNAAAFVPTVSTTAAPAAVSDALPTPNLQ